jgi:3-deoxy-D-manno-octulosonic-acid transferase
LQSAKHKPARFNLAEKLAFRLYDVGWELAIPALRLSRRLNEGLDWRTLQHNVEPAELWIHAASAGESYLALALVKNLPLVRPLRIMMTSGTTQGMEILQRAINEITSYAKGSNIFAAYFPFDKPTIMEKAVKSMQPRVTVFLESEIWPGLFAALRRHHCKILIVNGRMTRKSLTRYLIWPSFWHKLRPHKILAISETDSKNFSRLFGRECVGVMRNMKFDQIGNTESGSHSENPLEKIISPDRAFVVLGSVRREEEARVEKIIVDILQRQPRTVIGLFPRHIHRIRRWEKALEHMAIPWVLRSRAKKQVSQGTVILWDTFGELTMAYALARAAFVGGSLAPLGGQNFLEAVLSGVVPVIGPSWDDFAWVGHEILDNGLVRQATDWREVADVLVGDLKEPKSHKAVRKDALDYVKDHQGGTQKACELIVESLAQIP